MGYLRNVDATLHKLLAGLDDAARTKAIAFVKERILESYRNGINAGEKGADGAPRCQREVQGS